MDYLARLVLTSLKMNGTAGGEEEEDDGSGMKNPFENNYVVMWTMGMTLLGLNIAFLQWVNKARRTPRDRGWSAGVAAWNGFALGTGYIAKELFNGMACWMVIILVVAMTGMVVLPYFGLTLKMWIRHPRNPGKVRWGYHTVHRWARGNPDAFANWFMCAMMVFQGILVVSLMATKVDSPYNLGVLAQQCDLTGDLWVLILNFVVYVLLGLYMTVMLYDTHMRPYLLLMHEQTLVLVWGFALVTAYLALASKATAGSFEQWIKPDTLLYVYSMLPVLISVTPTVLAIMLLRLARACCPSMVGTETPETLGQLFTFYDRSRKPVVQDGELEISIGGMGDEDDNDFGDLDRQDLYAFSAGTSDEEGGAKPSDPLTRRQHRAVKPGLFEVKERIPLLTCEDHQIIASFEKISSDTDSHIMGIRLFVEDLAKIHTEVNEQGGAITAKNTEDLAKLLQKHTKNIHRSLF